MTELVLALVEAIGVGITVHAWDTGNLNLVIGGIGFTLLFFVWAVAGIAKEKATRR
ncbi:hypothetical protein [uncultured Lentilactobacillus sp.]|uniref:hypothetical protein n=1 Tax=uncultured Lentilactobacillus sp. TaxID=2805375 RepID=UPI0025983B8E|nr:hypothetical protein [uncultured Lentilactobacillus sp.]